LSPYWRRLLGFTLGAALCVLGYLFLLNFPGLGRQTPTAGLVPALAIASASWWLTWRFLRADQIPPAAIGLNSRARPLLRLAVGFVAGSLLTGVWLVLVTMTTSVVWQPNPAFRMGTMLGACGFNFFNNVGEELVYRGYAFVRLADRFGPVLTVGITSSLFALLHLQAGIPWLSVLAGVLTSGLIFGALFARWRSLPLALGFHVATNIVQDLSGLRPSGASLFTLTWPASGAAVGAETLGTIALLNVVIAVAILIVPWPSRQSRPD